MKNIWVSIANAVLVWILGVSFYLGSFYVSILDNPELQANIVLAFGIIPSAMIGTQLFYRRATMNPVKLSIIFVITAVVLDAIITVPVFVIPAGGTYSTFFGAVSFYLIALLYFITVMIYARSIGASNHKTETR